MRIIAGRLGGRNFDSPHSFKTHPMSDKIRGALFNVLGDIEGLTVLDAFAGSGALGFEAISRGAKAATLIDNDRAAQKVIAKNCQILGLRHQIELITASANTWLQRSPEARFDIVLCDPPYNDTQASLVIRLSSAVVDTGLLVVSWPGDQSVPEIPGFTIAQQRQYGDAQLVFYTR